MKKGWVIILLLLALGMREVVAKEPHHDSKKVYWFNTQDSFYTQRIWFDWGYNRAWFTKSDIHFKGPGYDFTVAKLVAHDRPAPFQAKLYFNPTTSSIPQYDWHIGFCIKKRWFVNIAMDHMKYVMVPDQNAQVTGTIDASKSQTYQGVYQQTNMPMSKDFLRFEHTNGLNLIAVEGGYLAPIFRTRKDILRINANVGVGLGVLVCKTDVKVLEYGLDNRFHLSGVSMHAIAGLRIDIWKYFFIASEAKGGYITLPDVLIHNNRTDLANHHFGYVQYQITAGLSYQISKLYSHHTKSKKG